MMDFSGRLLGPDASQPEIPPTSQLAPAGGFGAHTVAVPGGGMAASHLGGPDLNLQPLAPRAGLPQVLLRGWWLLAVGMAAGVGTAYAYCKRTTPLYTDTARVFLADTGPHVTEVGENVANNGYLQAQAEAIRSIPVMERAAAAIDAGAMRSFKGSKDLPASLQGSIEVDPDPRADSMLVLSTTTPYPDDGAKVLNGVIKAYAETAATARGDAISDVVTVLEKRAEAAKLDEDDARDKVKAFRQANPSFSATGDGTAELNTQITRLNDQLRDLQADISKCEVAIRQGESALATSEGTLDYAKLLRAETVSGGREYAMVRGEQDAAQRRLDQLLARNDLMPGNQALQSARNDLAGVTARLLPAATTMVQGYLQDVRSALAVDVKQQDVLTRSIAETTAKYNDVSGKATDFANLQGQLQARQAQRAELDRKVRDLQITGQTKGMTVHVVEPARPSAVKVWPIWSRSLAAGGFAGAVLGITGAILLAGVDSRLRTSDEAVEELAMPMLGVIPHIRGAGRGSKVSGAERARAVHLQPATAVAEAYRTIRTALYFGVAAGNPRRPNGGPRRILVTSPLPGDGKSTFASNLAIAMAQSGRRVVLVDADLRKPTQLVNHDMRTPSGTLADVFAGRIHLSKLVRATSIDRLHLLACGPAAGPAELLTSPLFGKMLDSLNRACDVVVIDSPPVLPVADARILAVGCDATILVLRAGKSTRRTARQARDSLLGVGASLVGTVMNDVARAAKAFGYAHPYGTVTERLPAVPVSTYDDPDDGLQRPADRPAPATRNGSPDVPHANGQVPEPAGH